MSGYLEVIFGCMFSGKTTKLIDIYKKYELCDISCVVVNYCKDTRYSNTHLVTHDKKQIPCIFTETLDISKNKDLHDLVITQNIDVILINEGQFFPSLYENVKYFVEDLHKKVYVCGLDGDFKRKSFGEMTKLIPISDKFYKQYAICKMCKNGTKACFSKRLSYEKNQTVIGSDNYIPVCRKCYEKD